MRRRRMRKVLGWGTLLVAAVAFGGGWFAFTYATDNDTLRAAIQAGAPRFLPGSTVDVRRVRVRPFAGKVTLEYLSVRQAEKSGAGFVGITPWVQLSFDPRGMLDGRFDLREIVVAQPTLRIRRRADGSWNFVGLLANPWPMPPSETTPPFRVENGTLELLDETDGPEARPTVVLRDVSIRVASGTLAGTPIRFEATAKGDQFDRVELFGSIDRASGQVSLKGDLTRLTVSKTLGDRLPAEARAAFRKLGLTGGEVDLTLKDLTLDPKGGAAPRYDLSARLRAGAWQCASLPFAVDNLAADLAFRDGTMTIASATGRSGPTYLRASGSIDLADPATAPFRLGLDVEDLEIERVRDWSIGVFKDAARGVFADFQPRGRIDLGARVARTAPGGPIGWETAVGLRDVSVEYREFRYPLSQVTGKLVCRPERVSVDLRTTVGGKPLTVKGTIDHPGPKSVVDLEFAAGSLPVDAALLKAMPPDVRKVVDEFEPRGTVRGTARVRRTPPKAPGDDPRGTIAIDAGLDLNPGFEITWVGLKYPVREMVGHLEIHPESWIFRDMKGSHGQATITGAGRIDRLGPAQFKVGLNIKADNLLFESQLREALQPAWQKTWNILNPTGASDVDVSIALEPGKPDRYYLKIDPRPETSLRLRFERVSPEGDPGGPREIEMPMEAIRGRFVFDNGTVTMTDGRFNFRNSPVRFDRGTVQVFDTGKFALNVEGLGVREFRFDGGLRKLMPPLMAGVALRLVDAQSFNFRTDLALAWSGKAGEPATCAWRNGTVTFLDNSFASLRLNHLQGQVDHLQGGFDGRELTLHGALDLGSVNLYDVQVTDLRTPIEIVDGTFRLRSIKGALMHGKLTGGVAVELKATPRFAASLSVTGANLKSYARSIPKKQTLGGRVDARIELSGLGQDVHSLQGNGEAHVSDGELGELPPALRPINKLNFAPNAKTLFDQVDVRFTVRNGLTTFDPIRVVGNLLSLQGSGTMDPQMDLNLKLDGVYSRDALHIPVLSDLAREVGGQLFTIRVRGPAADPDVKKEILPVAGELFQAFNDRDKVRPKPLRPSRARARK